MKMRERYLAAAMEEVGTAFHHQGRVPGVGLDCAGLVVTSGSKIGLFVSDEVVYPKKPDPHVLTKHMKSSGLKVIDRSSLRVGDVILFQYGQNPQHLAICSQVSPLRIVHATGIIGRVVEQVVDEDLARQMYAFFTFPFPDD